MTTMPSAALHDRNRRVGAMALAFALAMLALGYASVPLYRLFCQATGFGGTPARASEVEASRVKAAAGSSMSIRFDGNVDPRMRWQFKPERTTTSVIIGQRAMAFFEARNLSDVAVTGMATFNITPEQAGKYFTKIQCFCFTQQTLQAGQDVRMPVIYYVDPKIMTDPDTADVEQITLSYTFHPVAADAVKPLDPGKTAG